MNLARFFVASCTFAALFFVSTTFLCAQRPGDPPPRSITIDEAVRLALERNLTIALSRSNVETASARISGAFGSFLPQISLSSGYSKQLTEDQQVFVGGVPISSTRPDNSLNATATASLLLFDGFARTADYSSAQSSYNASLESYARTRQEIEYQTRAAYLIALRAEQIIEVRKSDLDVSNDRLRRTRQLVELGTAQIGQVYSIEADVANGELSLEQANTDALVARTNLALLLNTDPAQPLLLSGGELATSVDSAEVVANRASLGTLADLLERQRESRRDLQSARLRVESAESAVTAAKSGYWPSISTSLGWNWTKAGQFDASANTQFSVNLQYTPFDGFRTDERVELSRANLQSAQIDLERLQAQARSELQGVWARLDGAERQLRAAQKAVAAARQNRYAADERYRLGAGNEADYIIANGQYLSAQINQLNAIFSYRLILYELEYHIGR